MLYDISVVVGEETPEWPGDAPFRCNWSALIADGSAVNLSTIAGSPHVGTHADAPMHVRDGWSTSEHLPVAPFIGRVAVVDISDVDGEVSAEQLVARSVAGEFERVLLRTGRSVADRAFPDTWPVLSREALEVLLAAGPLQLLGTDAPSVDDRHSKTLPNHHALFSSGAYILENLDLRGVEPGIYELLALPMRVAGLDAAPVRAFLRTDPVR